MGIVSKFGLWLDKRFPEKVSAGEVYEKIEILELRLHTVTALRTQLEQIVNQHHELVAAHEELAKKVAALASENTALKAVSALRVRSSIPIPGR
jgi:hypothetical protein